MSRKERIQDPVKLNFHAPDLSIFSLFCCLWNGDSAKLYQYRSQIYLKKLFPYAISFLTWITLLVVNIVVDYHVSPNFNNWIWLIGFFGTANFSYMDKGTTSFLSSFIFSLMVQAKIVAKTGNLPSILHLFLHRILETTLLTFLLGSPLSDELPELTTILRGPVYATLLSFLTVLIRRILPLIPYHTILHYGEIFYSFCFLFFFSALRAQYIVQRNTPQNNRWLWEFFGLIFFPMCVSVVLNWFSHQFFYSILEEDIFSTENIFVIFGIGLVIMATLGLARVEIVRPRWLHRKIILCLLLLLVVVSEVVLVRISFCKDNLYPPVDLRAKPCPTTEFSPWSMDLVDMINEIKTTTG